jgi:hypothetical protein
MKVRRVMEKARVPMPPELPDRHVVDTAVRLPHAKPDTGIAARLTAPTNDPTDDGDERMPPDYFLG